MRPDKMNAGWFRIIKLLPDLAKRLLCAGTSLDSQHVPRHLTQPAGDFRLLRPVLYNFKLSGFLRQKHW